MQRQIEAVVVEVRHPQIELLERIEHRICRGRRPGCLRTHIREITPQRRIEQVIKAIGLRGRYARDRRHPQCQKRRHRRTRAGNPTTHRTFRPDTNTTTTHPHSLPTNVMQ